MPIKKYLTLERLQEYDSLIKQEVSEDIANAVNGKADATHSHEDLYYTQTQIDSKLEDKVNSSEVITIDEIDEICSRTIDVFLDSISSEGVSF